jgi:DNA topoisomerase-3
VAILSIEEKPKPYFKPYPMNTVALTKIAASNLRIGSSQVMNIAEKLYTSGLISYPRTETDKFNSTINLHELIGR